MVWWFLSEQNLNEDDHVIKNKEMLVCKGYSQVESSHFERKIFSRTVRSKDIRLLLAFFYFKNSKFYQMDVKTSFQNINLEKEVYIEYTKFLLSL